MRGLKRFRRSFQPEYREDNERQNKPTNKVNNEMNKCILTLENTVKVAMKNATTQYVTFWKDFAKKKNDIAPHACPKDNNKLKYNRKTRITGRETEFYLFCS